MFSVPSRPRHLTFWLTWGGAGLLAFPRTRQLGAGLWLFNGVAAVGIAWERACQSDMANLRSADWNAGLGCLARHSVQLLGGAAVLGLGRRA